MRRWLVVAALVTGGGLATNLQNAKMVAPRWGHSHSHQSSSLSKATLALRVSQLLFDPVGRGREVSKDEGSRSWADPMMTTHAAFVPAILVASSNGMYDLAAIQSVLLALSTAYHFCREVPGPLAQLEGTVAKGFFCYGLAQILLNRPADLDVVVYAGEIACAAATLGTFLATNLWPKLYERYHPIGLHVVPGIWSFLVATNHASLPVLF